MDRSEVVERAGELIAALGLTDASDKLVVDYSAGMTKKITLACALVHGPRLLVLDEPFEAVDPVSARTIRGILARFVDGGGTVVLSSHVMDLVERICTDVAIIAGGRRARRGATRPGACRAQPRGQVRRPRGRFDRGGGPGVVAHLVRLKLQLLRNGLRRSPAALVGLAVGAIYGGGLLALAIAGLVVLRFQGDVALVRTAVTLGGAALVLAWAVVPVLVFGTDPTLDPGRFATFSVPERQLAVGLAARGSSVCRAWPRCCWSRPRWSPGRAASPASWRQPSAGQRDRDLRPAQPDHHVGGGRGAQHPAGRDVLAMAGFAALLAFGPVVSLASSRELSTDDLAASPLRSAGRRWAGRGRRQPTSPRAGTSRDWSGSPWPCCWPSCCCGCGSASSPRWCATLAARPPRPRAAGHGGLGLLGRLPGTPLGAVAARSALYWRRDPRLNFPAVITSLLPAGLVLAWHFGHSDLALVGMPLVCAYLLGWGQHNDVGYDSTAFWLHVASGVDGTSDRVGRLFPSMALGAVLVPGYALVGSVLGGRWDLLPATLGVGLALLLSGFAVASVTSAVKQYPRARPGESPFATPPGERGSPSSCRPWSG